MDSIIWREVSRWSEAWRKSEAIAAFRSQLPRNATSRSSGLPGYLQELHAGGVPISDKPMELGRRVPSLLASLPMVRRPEGEVAEQLTLWLRSALKVEEAHRRTMAWLRSRMPGFPFVPAPPQLTQGSSLTTHEFTYDFVWLAEERSGGLQFRDVPPTGAQVLSLSGEAESEATAAIRDLARALRTSPEWRQLSSSKSNLTTSDRKQLRAVTRSMRMRLAPEAVDAHEGQLALRRDAYRRRVFMEESERLKAGAREYAEAFGEADNLLALVARDAFGQLCAYRVEEFSAVRDVTLNMHDGDQEVSFTTEGATWPEVGAIAWLEDPGVPDAVLVRHTEFRFDSATGEEIRVVGRRLVGTRDAWRH